MTTDENFLDDHTFLGDGHPDTLDQRLAREVPDHEAEEVPYERQPDAVGELVAVPDDDDEEQDVMADEAGPARDDAGAEQAAMHVIRPDSPTVEEDYSAFTSDADEDDEDEDEPDEDEEDEDSAGRDDDSGEFVFDAEYDED